MAKKNDYTSPLLESLLKNITPEEQARTDARMQMSARIYAALKEKGWTQTQLASALNKQVSVISRWLSGTHNFTIDTLTDIEGVLKVRLLDLENSIKVKKH
ncbi:helix-turn-helix domain-containing protein [Chitinophaga sp. SYP-B3965]|uniref:helix-turn-helix domain-containing protein n=1 Tax=Chitinophaga sp. SYP-B3965 TaxID=2663120 RepID=UPI0012999F89|nr:helix-turn-helix transcriptional regulator [Chitinophaga sp. SYP-B3965]MRG44967.1 helix-turn-helix domain-containing protein [Chitinophaga sp. SYP-B3965]